MKLRGMGVEDRPGEELGKDHNVWDLKKTYKNIMLKYFLITQITHEYKAQTIQVW